MLPLTILCHGTASFSKELMLDEKAIRQGELVQLLDDQFHIPDDQQSLTLNGGKLVLQGPGTFHGNDPRLTEVRATDREIMAVDRVDLTRAFGGAFGALLHGAGVGANVEKAIAFLKVMVRERMSPDCVNLVGWSRGAVTCVRIAQMLADEPELAGLEVNIFAGDPVPGFGRHQDWAQLGHWDRGYTISRNVGKYLHVMAMDVTGKEAVLFQPLLPQKAEGHDGLVAVIPLPGDHSGVVSAGSGAPGRITMDLAIRFLRLCGVSDDHWREGFVDNHVLARARTLDLYAEILGHIRGDYSYRHSRAYASDGPTLDPRSWAIDPRTKNLDRVRPYLGDYLADDDAGRTFVNYHHKLLASMEPGHGGPATMVSDGDPHGLRSLLSAMYS